jgi:hypothetical protein
MAPNTVRVFHGEGAHVRIAADGYGRTRVTRGHGVPYKPGTVGAYITGRAPHTR